MVVVTGVDTTTCTSGAVFNCRISSSLTNDTSGRGRKKLFLNGNVLKKLTRGC